MEIIKQQLSFLNSSLVQELLEHSTISDFPKGTQILRDEQYVKVLPIVLNGLVKVFSKFEEKELLLYYIQPKQSCVMSFSAALKNTPSKVFAITEEDSNILLIPTDKLPKWLIEFPDLNTLFYNQYDLRYSDLLDTIQHILIDKMDKRLFEYLKHKAVLTNNKSIKLTHGQIANELGTAREVISRVLKKLERENKVKQDTSGIIILSGD